VLGLGLGSDVTRTETLAGLMSAARWASSWATRVMRAGKENSAGWASCREFGPKLKIGKKVFPFYKHFFILPKLFEFKIKFKLQTDYTHKIKYKSTN
jgi:hypothetical protein